MVVCVNKGPFGHFAPGPQKSMGRACTSRARAMLSCQVPALRCSISTHLLLFHIALQFYYFFARTVLTQTHTKSKKKRAMHCKRMHREKSKCNAVKKTVHGRCTVRISCKVLRPKSSAPRHKKVVYGRCTSRSITWYKKVVHDRCTTRTPCRAKSVPR
jgi:hypothetical protein